jgi:uncharacterized membrane protein YccC
MTIAIVLRPDFTATFSRGVLRLAGTFCGLVISTALFQVLHPSLNAQVGLLAVMAFLMRCYGPANYGIFVTALTALVVLLIALTGVSPKEVIASRGLNTAAGGAIALLAYWVWPTWERKQVRETLAQMLDAYRIYFRAIREAYIQPDAPLSEELDRARMGARLARSNFEASFDRLSAEPGVSQRTTGSFGTILASTHRFVHAVMALDAGLSRTQPVPARDTFLKFADDIELTLYYLASALRGSPLTAGDLPNLREDHHALVKSGHSPAERYTLSNVETDRMTNSLNTLSEELMRWLDH